MKFSPALTTLLVLSTAIANAAELKENTLAAWDRYVETMDARLSKASASGPFLGIDEDPKQLQRLRGGDPIVWQIKNQSTQAVPEGMIHHWAGAVFVPNATLADALAAVRDYAQYPNWFGPTVHRANLLNQTGDEDRFALIYVRKVLFVTAVLETESITRFSSLSATRLYSVTRSSRIQDVHDYGKPGESRTLSDVGNGYLWRAYSVSRYEQRDSGLYIEQETIGLSRDIPTAIRWLVEPAIRGLSRDLMEKSLLQTRRAILLKSGR